ncbi:MAG: RluA family pseudouridine synthase [Gammaproteobacteria bacterium]|nr:RluA family pseudouridine synthase [Gammaproteobacteria bacterium]MYF02621.1 RluA family pseudouridine synthase [Gammaproteobacteria bacterium]MYI77702.1 RluA family pseudouridine synthase [Gammaproteobacteria bacterium]
MTPVQQFTIRRHAGQRLDNFLLRELKPVPRSRIMRMIRSGEVRVNGKRAKVHLKLSEGDRIRVPPLVLEEDNTAEVPGWLIDVVSNNVIYESDRLIAVNKPSGISVHAGTSVDVGLVDAVREYFDDDDIQLGHRIDRDTSGCVLFAKTRVALLEIHHALQHHQFVKQYEGIVAGCWPHDVSEITVPLRKFRLPNNERRVEVHKSGKAAATKFEILRSSDSLSWLRIEPTTGRTHQIRVHCQYQGHAIVGDSKYAIQRSVRSPNMLLHALSVQFVDGLTIQAPVPSYFEEFWHQQAPAG